MKSSRSSTSTAKCRWYRWRSSSRNCICQSSLLPVILPRRSDALYLVQRVRDEAHRFAITSHRARRNKIGMVSQLEAIPGVGPAKRKALMKAFGNSIDAIRAASADELAAVPGINAKLAVLIKESL